VTQQAGQPTRGRPRSPEADRSIIDATLRLLERDGYSRMSMERVAEEAGVGKTTIYRRYRSKADLVTGALAAIRGDEHTPDTGDTRADLLEMMRRFAGTKGRSLSMHMTGAMFAAQEHDAELVALFRERIIEPRRRQGLEVIRRGIERGDIRPDVDAALLLAMMVGSWFAIQISGLQLDDDWATAVVEQVWPAFATSSSS
jgi:AcrR family transcriptional regulator